MNLDHYLIPHKLIQNRFKSVRPEIISNLLYNISLREIFGAQSQRQENKSKTMGPKLYNAQNCPAKEKYQ